jgi:hypothetical protein
MEQGKPGVGTTQQFNQLLVLVETCLRQYESGKIKHMIFAQQIDSYFAGSYGWHRTEFYQELRRILETSAHLK